MNCHRTTENNNRTYTIRLHCKEIQTVYSTNIAGLRPQSPRHFSTSLRNRSDILPQSRDSSSHKADQYWCFQRYDNDLRAHEFAHSPYLSHQPRLANGYLRLKLETLWN